MAAEFSEFSPAFVSSSPAVSTFAFFRTCSVEATTAAEALLLPDAVVFVFDGKPMPHHQ